MLLVKSNAHHDLSQHQQRDAEPHDRTTGLTTPLRRQDERCRPGQRQHEDRQVHVPVQRSRDTVHLAQHVGHGGESRNQDEMQGEDAEVLGTARSPRRIPPETARRRGPCGGVGTASTSTSSPASASTAIIQKKPPRPSSTDSGGPASSDRMKQAPMLMPMNAMARVRISVRVRSASSAVTGPDTAPAPWMARATITAWMVEASAPTTEPAK